VQYVTVTLHVYQVCHRVESVAQFLLTQLNTEYYGRRCLTTLSAHRYNLTIVNKHYHFMTSSDRFPVPDRSAVKSDLTAWCCHNLSSRALNALTVLASTAEFSRSESQWTALLGYLDKSQMLDASLMTVLFFSERV